MSRRAIALPVVCVAAALLAACGGDDAGGGGATLATSAGSATSAVTVAGGGTTTVLPPSTGTTAGSTGAGATSTPTTTPGEPQTAEQTAKALYEAWRSDDRQAASYVADAVAQDALFATSGEGANWTFQGCEPAASETESRCAFSYEGGAAFMSVALSDSGVWHVTEVTFAAD